jgi:hypothetical protein
MIRQVYVYRHSYIWAGKDVPYSLAYVTLQTPNFCLHEVESEGLTLAQLKRKAINDHREHCGNRITS